MNKTVSMKFLSYLLFLLIGVALSFQAGTALAAWEYIGWGHFTTSSIAWCHVGGDWYPNSQAVSKWSSDTDLSLYNNCYSEKVTTSVYDFGPGTNNIAGMAYICSYPYCNNSTAWNNNYSSCQARSNSRVVGSWTNTEKQFNASHELGHCWSLGHRTGIESDSVMRSGRLTNTNPNSTDESLVNARH